MELLKISALIIALACASATNENMFENGDRIAHYIGRTSGFAEKFKPKIIFSEEYQREVPQPRRSIRAAINSNSPESPESLRQNLRKEPSKPYYFDYLIKGNPDSKEEDNIHFHIQEKFENGTVEGVYAHGKNGFGFILVRYLADANGYRAKVEKEENHGTFTYGLQASRSSGKINFYTWGMSGGIAAAVQNLYTPGNNTMKDEEEEY